MREETNHTDDEPQAGILAVNKGKLLIALVLVLGALAYFGFIAFQGATVYYVTVGELKEREASEGQIVRVSGKLIPESYRRDGATTIAYFSLTDGVDAMPAVYQGALPDLFFNEHSEIILEGTYSAGHEFETQNVIVKCPSKYIAEADEPEEIT